MGDKPQAVNSWASLANGTIDALMDGGLLAGEAYLLAQCPVLATMPVVWWLMKQALGFAEGWTSKVSQKAATRLVIDVQIHGEESAVLTQATALQIALNSGNDKEQQDAIENASKAWAGIIHFDGIAPPK